MFRLGQFLSHLVLLISYLANGVLAQTYTSATECGRFANLEHNGVYQATRSLGTSDPMRWCPYWALECAFVYQRCPGVVTCSFTNHDSRLPTYDPSASGNSRSFLSCRFCNVEVDPVSVFPSDVRVPRITATISTASPTSSDGSPTPTPTYQNAIPTDPTWHGLGSDVTAERSSIYTTTLTLTALFVLGGFLGSAFLAKTTRSSVTTIGQTPRGPGVSPGTIFPPTSLANNSKASRQALSDISPFTLLLHFQSISTSGFLSISYAPIYQYFTFNFSWANLIIPLDFFKSAARKLDSAKPQCVRGVQSNLTFDQETMGLGFVAQHYIGNRGSIGTLAFLSAIAVVVIVLLLSVLVALVLHILSKLTKSSRIQAVAQAWPSTTSKFILRLFVWLLGSISTFAFYQFSQSCSSPSLLALSAVEFACLVGTLFIVSVLVLRTVRREGSDVLFPTESGDTKYSRRWGSLYGNLKPSFYWWYMPDIMAVLVRSAIVSFAQGAGLSQLIALLSFDFVFLMIFIPKRPYRTKAGNLYQLFSTGKRLVTTATLFVYWQGIHVKAEIQRAVGMALMIIESAHAAVLIIVLLISGVMAISRSRSRGDENHSMTRPFMQHTESEMSEAKFEPTGLPTGYRYS